MQNFPEYEQYDALGLAELVRKRQVQPIELLNAAISRIELRNPKINAVIHKMYERGKHALTGFQQDGPFAGVPFLLKDLLAAFAGEPLTNGSRAYRNYIPHQDSELVQRFKKAGVVILGKTNSPEFGLMGVTEPELHGPTRNPWAVDRTPGGSSGGSAAAVSSGMVPIASAGDGGGSIRIPASACGLFGLKPSRGRNPLGPGHGEVWQGAVVEHILSRSVRDSAAMLDTTCGNDSGTPYVTAGPGRSYLSCLERDPSRLRIAFSTESPIGMGVHNDCVDAVQKTAQLLSHMGHDLVQAKPPINGNAMALSYIIMYFGEMAEELRSAKETLGRNPKNSEFEPATRLLALMGRSVSAGDFVWAMKQWHLMARSMGQFHQDYDLYLTPTMAFPPVRIGELQPKTAERITMNVINLLGLGKLLKATGMVEQMAKTSLAKTPFTQLANMTGQPAMSVPLHWSASNLPIGVQFMAPIGCESVLFSLAGQLERAAPWFAFRPDICDPFTGP